MIDSSQMKQWLNTKYPNVQCFSIDPNTFVFEERVKLKCFHCKNYNYKWTCPPKIPQIDYMALFAEYKNALVLMCKMSIIGKDIDTIRFQSTNMIHRALLFLETELYNNNEPMAISFIGGSCKLCKNGCDSLHCANPYLSRIPWEATGCNVVETLKSNGVSVRFPIDQYLCRYGLLLY